jgi:hypothetical protein
VIAFDAVVQVGTHRRNLAIIRWRADSADIPLTVIQAVFSLDFNFNIQNQRIQLGIRKGG